MNVGGGQFLDCYNQIVYSDVVAIIKTNIDKSYNYFIYEEDTK